MIVMKFGGTSLADASRMQQATQLVAERAEKRPVVVVSASSGVTNRLLAAATSAEKRNEQEMVHLLEQVGELQREILTGLGLPPERHSTTAAGLEASLNKLGDLVRGVYLLGECTARSRDAISAMGEVMSHRLFAEALRQRGTGAVAVDPRVLVPTDSNFGEAAVDEAQLRSRCEEHLIPCIEQGTVPVTGGFVGATERGVTTTLGRGGSDLSATLIGAAIAASEVQIWTDVEGMMTADPRVVPKARLIPEVAFEEAAELAYFGAKVLHPATIRPAVEEGIPVRILNTFNPGGGGTVIRKPEDVSLPERAHVRAVAWKDGITVVSVSSSRMLGAHGFLAKLFDVFDRHGTAVDLVTTSEVSVSLTVEDVSSLDEIRLDLDEFCRSVKIENDMSLVCLVGHHLLREPDLTGRVLASLQGLPLRMVCLGSTDINLSLVLEQPHASEAIQRLHREFLESGD